MEKLKKKNNLLYKRSFKENHNKKYYTLRNLIHLFVSDTGTEYQNFLNYL